MAVSSQIHIPNWANVLKLCLNYIKTGKCKDRPRPIGRVDMKKKVHRVNNHNFYRKTLARRIRRKKPFLALKGYHGNFLGKYTFSYV